MSSKILAACLVLMGATLASGFQHEWVSFTSAVWRCSALMPQHPTLNSQETTSGTGEKLTQYVAKASDADSLYALSYLDYPPSMTFSLDKGRDGIVAALKGTLLSEEVVSLGEYPGREIKVAAKIKEIDLLIRARLYNVGNRVYVLQHIVPKVTDSAATTEKSTKFFNSFKVTAGT